MTAGGSVLSPRRRCLCLLESYRCAHWSFRGLFIPLAIRCGVGFSEALPLSLISGLWGPSSSLGRLSVCRPPLNPCVHSRALGTPPQTRRDPDGAHASIHLTLFNSPTLPLLWRALALSVGSSSGVSLSAPDLLQPANPQGLWNLTRVWCWLLFFSFP